MATKQTDLNLIEKPWGSYAIIYQSPKRLVKILFVLPHSQLSLQSHQHRAERWIVLSGQATVILKNETYQLSESETIFINKEEEHRLINNSDEPLEVLESSYGDIITEEDIVRYEDAYGR